MSCKFSCKMQYAIGGGFKIWTRADVRAQNEIRRAVHPLATELKESREVIERQRREIERLRRGY